MTVSWRARERLNEVDVAQCYHPPRAASGALRDARDNREWRAIGFRAYGPGHRKEPDAARTCRWTVDGASTLRIERAKMERDAVVFALISDTHIGPTQDYERHGFAPYPCARRLVEVLNDLRFDLDFIVHAGDVVTEPDEASYLLAAETFAPLRRPTYYVAGNHDRAIDMRRHLTMGPRRDLTDDPALLAYAFDVRGQRFVVVDACGPAEVDPNGVLSPTQLAVLDRELCADGPPLALFCHFPPLDLGIPWIDETMLIINGWELHRRLVVALPRLQGVFIGHIHQALTFHRDGVHYSAAPSAFAQLGGDVSDNVPRVDGDGPPGFAIVRIDARQTVVRYHAFARP
jgi:3',5'-cyclic-AMP phosphodiesterase